MPPVDVELMGVGIFANAGGVLLGLGELDADPGELSFHFGEPGHRSHLVLAGVGQTGSGRLDVLGQVAVAAGEQQLLPAPHLVAQPLEAPGLGRLALERPALLLDLEDDVVETREVLLRGVELELGGAAPRLVLGDTRSLFDQLAPIGRPRAQDHADLALLDDRVGLGTEAGVHQQLVDVAQPAMGAVDEVLALARAVEAPGDLDVADRLDGVEGQRCRGSGGRPGDVVAARIGARWQRHAAQPERHFRRPGGLAGIAAAEDDVLHLVAAQALGALLAEHPGERVGDIALAAAIRTDDRGHAAVEGQLGAIGERLESRDFEAIETHGHPRGRGRMGGSIPRRFDSASV